MIRFLVSFITLVSNAQAATPLAKAYSAVVCPAPSVIAKSYLELQTNGFRVSKKCIDRAAYPYLSLGVAPRGQEDGVPSKAEPAVESNPFTIDRVEDLGSMHYKVSFHYHVQSGAKIKEVADTLYFDTLEGPLKERMGCALLAKPPQQLVVRARCER